MELSFVSVDTSCFMSGEHRKPVHLVQIRALKCIGEPLRQCLELRRVHIVAGDLADCRHGHVLGHGQCVTHPQREDHLLFHTGVMCPINNNALGFTVEGDEGLFH